jgi:acetylornithine deacetylase/succinyl-diaminopimelate desuccinylase-like protein
VDFEGRPELVFGAKGLAYVELHHRGLIEDQHSSLAATIPSPVWHLVEALATLRSPDGRVLIDGFYDDVLEPDASEAEMLRDLPFDEAAELKRTGASAFVGGDEGYDVKRRHVFEPTCNIAGLVSGFTVPGASKTVLPKEALAKLDLRLVPNQDPKDIVAKLRAHLDRHGFGDIEIDELGLESPAKSESDSLVGRAALEACKDVFDLAPAVAPMMAGTGPMYPIASTLGIPTVSPAGVHNPDSNIHAPNENCKVEDFLKTLEYTVAYLHRFGTLET